MHDIRPFFYWKFQFIKLINTFEIMGCNGDGALWFGPLWRWGVMALGVQRHFVQRNPTVGRKCDGV